MFLIIVSKARRPFVRYNVGSVDQIGKMFVMFDKMTLIAQDIASKRDGSRESLGMRLREHNSLVRAGENDEKFHTVYKEEIAEFLPKIIARTAASSNNCKTTK